MSEQKKPTKNAFPSSDLIRKVVPSVLLMAGGMLMIQSNYLDIDFYGALKENIVSVIGFSLIIVGMVKYGKIFYDWRFGFGGTSFQDVDRKGDQSDRRLDLVLSRLVELQQTTDTVDYNKIAETVSASVETRRPEIQSEALENFRSYFASIVSIIEHKSNVADEKASILLDKGTAYSRWGIFFFLFSIISWQIVAWVKTFEVQMIYGIISCSVLFAFIEFLSAWFLRQYRHFVDTSTYLIKVKSIFDKYLLTFLALENLDGISSEQNAARFDKLVEILKEDIKWPDDHIFTRGDVNFAKEALESATSMMQTMRKSDGKD